jgi:hypothetical protein
MEQGATMDDPAVAITDDVFEAPFDVAELERRAPALAEQFTTATPFPHLVVDGLLRLPPSVMTRFPTADWTGWNSLGDAYQVGKLACDRIELIPEPFARIIEQLSEPRALRALETITGIRALLPDPYLVGGGLHMSGPGGSLAPHTDFHNHRSLDLYRRVNILLYLNPEWDESFGGNLELEGDDPSERVVVTPTWGRLAMFATDDRSVHGFPMPVGEGHHRRSIALYYYTATEAPDFSGDTTTYWREHGVQTGVRRLRLAAYRGLLSASRGLSIAAHIANPNVGMGVLRSRQAQRKAKMQ